MDERVEYQHEEVEEERREAEGGGSRLQKRKEGIEIERERARGKMANLPFRGRCCLIGVQRRRFISSVVSTGASFLILSAASRRRHLFSVVGSCKLGGGVLLGAFCTSSR